MPQVTVTIAGRAYRMACGEGEEPHLEHLAALFESKIQDLRGSFGEIGDMRLHVMAALTVADELVESRKRLGELQDEVRRLHAAQSEERDRADAFEAQAADAIDRTAERIERLARNLNPPATSGS